MHGHGKNHVIVTEYCVQSKNTVKPLSIVSEGTTENERWMRGNDTCGKTLQCVINMRKQKMKILHFLLWTKK
jgi:hypothetical protein